LGISLDRNDHYSEGKEKCNCTVNKCNIFPCECHSYCLSNLDVYKRIKSKGFTHTAFLTFNPTPKTKVQHQCNITPDYELFKQFYKDYFKKNANIIDYILVAELTKKGQMHYHCYFSYKNKVTVIKQIVQPMYFEGNILILHGIEPKMGIHYLFKEADTMKEYLDNKPHYISGDCVTTKEGPSGP